MITLKDKVVVSDPCYKLGLSGQLCLRGVKPGKESYAANVNDDDFDDLNSWYRRVCNKTIEESCWGEIDGLGCVSESGWGDGCYECLVGRNEAGEIVGIRLVYIEEMEEEDDE